MYREHGEVPLRHHTGKFSVLLKFKGSIKRSLCGAKWYFAHFREPMISIEAMKFGTEIRPLILTLRSHQTGFNGITQNIRHNTSEPATTNNVIVSLMHPKLTFPTKYLIAFL